MKEKELMEEKYGKKLHKLGTLPMVYMPEVCLDVALIIIFGVLLNSAIKSGAYVTAGVVVSFILAAAVFVFVFRLIFASRVEIYENAIVVFGIFGSKVYEAEKISAIIWSMPGANAVNSRAARTNNTIAELIIKGEHKSVRLSDAYYRNLEKPISAFQAAHKIPKEL